MIAVNAESVFFDIGYKSEGILPADRAARRNAEAGRQGLVTVKGRDLDGYYELSRFKVERPMDWTALEKAFAEKSDSAGHGHRRHQGRLQRRRRRARLHARLAQRSSRSRRDGKAGRAGDPLPHHQARRHR